MDGGMTNQISNWAGGGATTTLGAAQLAYGLYMNKKNKRPEYQIPQEVQQNLTQAQQMALQGLPEEQKQQFIKNIQRGTAFGMNQLGSRKAGLSGLASLNQQQQDAYGNMLSMDAQARQQNQQGLMNQRQVMADYRDQAFQLNKLNPYYEKTAQSQAMMGAGMQNMSQGFQQGNQGSVDWSGGKQQQQMPSTNNFQYGKSNGGYDAGDYNRNLDTSGYV